MCEQMQAQITAIKGGDLSRKSQMRLEELTEVQNEVQSKCAEIKEKVEEVRTVVGRHIYSAKTFQGCLTGAVDDYLEQFDS